MNTLKIDAKTLADNAAWIAKGAPRRAAVPVLATAHVSVTDTGLQLRMTDYDLFREVITPAENAVASDFAVLVDPDKLAKFLKGAKGDALVSVDVDGIRVEFGGRTVNVGSVTGGSVKLEDFPTWPEFIAPDSAIAVLDPATIKRALTSVGKDGTLPMLTGVRFDDDYMVTTDRFRMTRTTFDGSGFDALAPREPLQLFTVGKGDVTVAFGKLVSDTNSYYTKGHVMVSRDGRSAIVRELDAEFPKYRQLIPSEDNVTVIAEFRKADLLAALAGDTVDLTVNVGGTITVDARERSYGDVVASQTIAAEVASNDELPFTILVASKYVSDALKGIADDVVSVWFTTSTRPMVFQGGSDLHLVMPQRRPA